MKKFVALLLAVVLLLLCLVGCGNETATTAESASTEETAETAAETEAATEKKDITLEIYYVPWTGIPIEGDDMYIQWIEEVTGCNCKLTYANDFESEILTRAAANNMPDLIVFDNYVQLFKLYDEGILMDDWNAYADQLPDTFGNISETQMNYFTVDGKLISVPTLGGEQLYTFMIRKDWLENLGLEMPTTVEELLEVARAFTYDDPDGNGKDDTYGFCSAGSGSMCEIMQLKNLWSPY